MKPRMPLFDSMTGYALIILLSFSSCESNTKDNRSTDFIPDVKQEVSLKSLCSSIEVIPLETNDSSLIAVPSKIICYNSKYFVFDSKQYAVFIFNEDGSFCNKICEIGKGPGEYILLDDFDVNPFENTVELLSPRGAIYAYSFEGKFLRKTDFPPEVRAVHSFINYSRDTIVLYCHFEKKRVKLYSRIQKKILSELFEVPEFLSDTWMNCKHHFYRYNDTVYFTEPFEYKIFYIDQGNIREKYSYDLGANSFDYSMLPEDRPAQYYIQYFNLELKGKAHTFSNPGETTKYRTFCYFIGKEWRTVLYNKKTGQSYSFHNSTEKVWFPFIVTNFPEGFIGLIEPDKRSMFLNEKLLDKDNYINVKDLRNDQNPVVVKYYFK